MSTNSSCKSLLVYGVTLVGSFSLMTISDASIANALPLPTVPGFEVEIYANVPTPGRLAFAPTGELFVGNGASVGKVRRVSIGGSSVNDYGAAAIGDPDAVLFDASGVISGTPGSVLVGGQVGVEGRISAILPDETVITVFSTLTEFFNIQEMAFDSTDRLVFVDGGVLPPTVWASTGSFPTLLFSVSGSDHIPDLAIDDVDQITTRDNSGTIRIHDATGTTVSDPFTTIPTSGFPESLEYGLGGAWGTDLYSVAGGNLLHIDSLGATATIGTGFGKVNDIKFGIDGAMYLSDRDNNRILRVSPLAPVPEPSTYVLAAIGLFGLGFVGWRLRTHHNRKAF